MGLKLKVPEARRNEPGVFIGGQWVPFVDGVVHVPDGCNYSLALGGFEAVAEPAAAAGQGGTEAQD